MISTYGLMPDLQRIADDAVYAPRLRAYFSNMLFGIDLKHVNKAASRRLMQDMFSNLAKAIASGGLNWANVYVALMEAIENAKDKDYYQTRQSINDHVDARAVTFQNADAGALGDWVSGPATAASLAYAVRAGTTRPGAVVGLPGRAVWLTPLIGDAATLIDRARRGISSDLAKEVRDLIANSGWMPKALIVALITRGPIGMLTFSSSSGSAIAKPVGSTILEARTHKHFRHWPRDRLNPDRYGRSYHFDPSVRGAASPPLSFGIREAVRTPIPLDQFSECVVIGKLTRGGCHTAEPDEEFLKAIGATTPASSILEDLVNKL